MSTSISLNLELVRFENNSNHTIELYQSLKIILGLWSSCMNHVSLHFYFWVGIGIGSNLTLLWEGQENVRDSCFWCRSRISVGVWVSWVIFLFGVVYLHRGDIGIANVCTRMVVVIVRLRRCYHLCRKKGMRRIRYVWSLH